ncbi:hypothetical protein K402DRAFT_121215 [Aulographum hederae CBS 113979]|uniref:Uncharacterized protein n=1 Tax=Aulographum hederae CBS 113979 TaxID=1176131 RepID=A0A6G1GVS9_9PEZI|nr:hypothetical protein K402DRAFT_121215 [Aulographum hederae CBS 113979]
MTLQLLADPSCWVWGWLLLAAGVELCMRAYCVQSARPSTELTYPWGLSSSGFFSRAWGW